MSDYFICIGSHTPEKELTQFKVYEALNGIESGIFAGRPFITVIGESGEKYSCHASRFQPVKIFTHSYFHGGGAEVNHVRAYFSDFRILKARGSHCRNSETTEYLQAKQDGFLFCKWLNISDHTMLMVKPSDHVSKIVDQKFDYNHESMQINVCGDELRIVWTGRSPDSRMYWTTDAVAGDCSKKDFEEWAGLTL